MPRVCLFLVSISNQGGCDRRVSSRPDRIQPAAAAEAGPPEGRAVDHVAPGSGRHPRREAVGRVARDVFPGVKL